MSKVKVKKIASYIITALLLISCIIFSIILFNVKIIPRKIVIAVLIVLWIVAILLSVFMIRGKKAFWPLSVIAVIVAIILGFGDYYLYHTGRMMDDVTKTVVQKDSVSAYVLKDDAAQSLSDAGGYEFGIVSNVDRDNTDKAIAQMESGLDFKLQCKEYDDMLSMINDLYANKVNAVILNDSFIDVIAENEGYENVKDDLRVLANTINEQQVVQQNVPELKGSFVLYISGIDTYGGVTNKSRSDVNIMAVVNTETKQILLVSTPRDYYVELPNSKGAKDKLTHAGIYGVENSMGAMQMLYGIQPNYFLRMNFSGFIDIINALGGIDVYSEYEFTVDPIMTYKVGINHVDGLQALAFARERHSFAAGDNQRGKDQMEVIKAVIKKCSSKAVLSNYSELMSGIEGAFETNIPQDKIAEIVNAQLFNGGEWNVVSYSVTGSGASKQTFSMPGRNLYVMEPNMDSVEQAKQLMQKVIDGETISQP